MVEAEDDFRFVERRARKMSDGFISALLQGERDGTIDLTDGQIAILAVELRGRVPISVREVYDEVIDLTD